MEGKTLNGPSNGSMVGIDKTFKMVEISKQNLWKNFQMDNFMTEGVIEVKKMSMIARP